MYLNTGITGTNIKKKVKTWKMDLKNKTKNRANMVNGGLF